MEKEKKRRAKSDKQKKVKNITDVGWKFLRSEKVSLKYVHKCCLHIGTYHAA